MTKGVVSANDRRRVLLSGSRSLADAGKSLADDWYFVDPWAKSEIHAVLDAPAQGPPTRLRPFGGQGRRLADQSLDPLDLGVDELDVPQTGVHGLLLFDRQLQPPEDSPQLKWLMTVPGVNIIRATIFLAAVGDIDRFKGLFLEREWRSSAASIVRFGHGGRPSPCWRGYRSAIDADLVARRLGRRRLAVQPGRPGCGKG